MSISLSGATRVHFIVGDPIAQVKSPAGVTQLFQARGHEACCVPAHVAPAQLATWVSGVSLAQNVDGIIVTVPHKFAASGVCHSLSAAARFLGAVNVMRRDAAGRWHGDMFDGTGFVAAMHAQGYAVAGRKVLLVGAGGAGSAIAYALLQAGVSTLAIHDEDEQRRHSLMERLAALGLGAVVDGSADPTGFDAVINATPMGMKEGDPDPVDMSRLTATMWVGCVITQPAVSPLIAKARALGCASLTGAEMFAQVRDLMVDFLLERV